jgi:HK97 gp10 family phage protein
MIGLNIKVEGLESLLKALNQIGDLKKSTADAVELCLQKIVGDAKAVVPVRTGRLQQSISWWGGGGEYHVGSPVEYAGYVEYGTSRMTPRAYLTPSLIQNVPLLKQTLRSLIEGWLEGKTE